MISLKKASGIVRQGFGPAAEFLDRFHLNETVHGALRMEARPDAFEPIVDVRAAAAMVARKLEMVREGSFRGVVLVHPNGETELHPDEISASLAPADTPKGLEVLDQSAAKIAVALAEETDVEYLTDLLVAEHNGKTRKNVVEILTAAIARVEDGGDG